MGKSRTTKSNSKSSNYKGKSKDASFSFKTTAKGNSKSDKLKTSNSVDVRRIHCERRERGGGREAGGRRERVETILDRLANGKKFDAVARELSEDKACQGRSLGWKARGSQIKAFEDAAYALAVSAVDRTACIKSGGE